MPEKPHNFWQELKRRKVIRVIAMYAGAAYVIIELINNIVEPLRLPEWVPTFIIILLVIGFPFAVIFSWIFDFTPKGIEKTKPAKVAREQVTTTKPPKRKLKVSDIIISVLLVAVIVLVYPKIFKKDTLERLRASGERISVAVMPFQNMTNDTTWNIWQNGIQDILITNLSNASDELSVRQIESVNRLVQNNGSDNYASITPTLGSTVSRKLNANLYVYGNIKQAGSILRIYAQLIETKTGEVFKSFQIESAAEEENIFQVIDSLSGMVKDFLVISKLIKEVNPVFKKYGATTKYPEAIKYVFRGNNAFLIKHDYQTAIDMCMKAIAIDSSYIWPEIMISFAYKHLGSYEQGREWCQKIYEKRDQMPLFFKTYANVLNASYNETPYETIKYLRQLLEIDDQLPDVYTDIGTSYLKLQEYSKAIPEYEKALEIYEAWGIKPIWVNNYTLLGDAYHITGQYKKEEKLYKKAEEDFPGDINILCNQTVLYLVEKDTINANQSVDMLISSAKENSASDAEIAKSLADLYSDACYLDRSEEYYRQALSLEPESPARMNSLASFLIYNDRNIEEGLGLIEKALELSPDHYEYLDTKGWGLYKQGKYQEALQILQKSWDLRRENAVYNHKAFLHLEAAKKAVASQKSEQ